MYHQDLGDYYSPEAKLADVDIELIKAYLQGGVYCWCSIKKKAWFTCRDFIGGANFYWEGTPLYKLYDWHTKAGKLNNAAIKAAGLDAGTILKAVIRDDKRLFNTKKDGTNPREYAWDGC